MPEPKILFLDGVTYCQYLSDGRFYLSRCGKIVKSYDSGVTVIVPKVIINSNGYPAVYAKPVSKSTTAIHRMVALTYLPNPGNLTDVNHKDGNKSNNHVDNLEWCSRRDNLHHAMRTGLHANPEKAVVGWNPDTGQGWYFVSQRKASEFGFTQANVSHCVRGNRAKCKGYHWEYYDNAA